MKNKLIDYTVILSGAAIYAFSVSAFTAPNKIAPGGFTGIGTLLNYLFSIPIGTFILAVNVPLLFLALKKLGKSFALKTVSATIAVSLLIDILNPIVSGYKGDKILVAVFGGFFNGLGLSLVFCRGGSTGGSDIIAMLIHKRFPQFSIGYIVLFFDAVVILLAGLVYGSFESAMYAVISIFVSSKVIDAVTYGASRGNGKLIMIITERSEKLLPALLKSVPRGVTVADVKGGYSGLARKLLLCAVRPNQVFKVNSVIKANDNNAFVIITNAGAILGRGFRDKTQ